MSYGVNRLRQSCRYARWCDPREEPDALTRTSGSVRGARSNPGPYRAVRQANWQNVAGESPVV